MMPRLDGLSAVMKIRERKNIPIIVLSAKSEETDKILGLSMGADDYVAKPFHPQELAARVKSQLRRYTMLGDIHAGVSGDEIRNGRLTYRQSERTLYADGEPVRLTATETKIVDEKSGSRLPGGGDLPPGLGGRSLCAGKYSHGTYPPHS